MTVTTELSRSSHPWTGVETSFAPGFSADREEDVLVFFRTVAGVQSLLTPGVNHTVALASETKIITVTPIAMPEAAGTVVVIRDTPALVLENLTDGEEFSLAVIQQLHDRAAMRSAEDGLKLERAITLPETAEAGVDNYNLGGSGLSNMKDGMAPTDAATVRQVQAMQVADGNVPSPVLGDVHKLVAATAADEFGWVFLALAHIANGLFTADAAGRAKFAAGFVNTGLLADGALSADAAGLAKMADAFLAASTAGRLKMADGFFSADAAGLAKFADGFLTANAAGRLKMADKFVTLAKLLDIPSGFTLGRKTALDGVIELLSAADARSIHGTLGFTDLGAIAAASQTAMNWTTIPAGAREIELDLIGISTSGTSPIVMQLGAGGAVETSNYLGEFHYLPNGASPVVANHSASFVLVSTPAAVGVYHGRASLRLANPATNTWTITTGNGGSHAGVGFGASGSKALAGPLDRIRLTMANGTDTFDVGSAAAGCKHL